MQTHWRHLAMAAALSVGVSTVFAASAVAQQDQNQRYDSRSAKAQRADPDTYANHPEYSNNEYYRTGNDEGYQDYKAKQRRERHEHQYRNDDDRKAHDYGYNEGWSGRSYRDDTNRRTSDDDQTRSRDHNQDSQYRRQEDQKHDKVEDHDTH